MQSSIANFMRLSFGNIIEWYDFSLYIYFAVFIAKDFFPNHDPFVSMLFTFSAFFLGSLVRPFGGLIVGWFSDRYHPKMMINICVITMGVSTFIVAFLPDYKMIGIFAPILLVGLRIIQGLSVGGQFPSLISLSVKDHRHNKGFAVGLIFSISSLGFLLASIVAFFASSYFADRDTQLIWRIPFALSGILFLFYLYLNRNENYNYSRQKSHSLGVMTSLAKQYKAIFAVTCLTTMAASIYYIVFTYLVNYQITELGQAKQTAFFINSLILIIACICYPFFGQLSDAIGAKHLFYIAGGLFFLFAIPAMHLMHSKQPVLIFFVMTILTLLTGAIQGAISPLFAKIFEPQWQTTGCAFSYSIGNGLSGAAPLVALTLVNINPFYGLSIFIILLLSVGSFGLMLVQKMKR